MKQTIHDHLVELLFSGLRKPTTSPANTVLEFSMSRHQSACLADRQYTLLLRLKFKLRSHEWSQRTHHLLSVHRIKGAESVEESEGIANEAGVADELFHEGLHCWVLI
jgi:hypothetical protein